MPTPSRYDKIALKVSPHKRRILGFAGVAFLCILISGFAGAYLNGILFSLSGVGLITLIWSWGLFALLLRQYLRHYYCDIEKAPKL